MFHAVDVVDTIHVVDVADTAEVLALGLVDARGRITQT